MLGKRKRETTVVGTKIKRREEKQDRLENVPTIDYDVFRKHFESTFEPLPENESATPTLDEYEDSEVTEDSEWAGLSDSEPTSEPGKTTVEIIEHRTEVDEVEDAELQRQQYKTFMSSRPPKETVRSTVKQPSNEVDEEDGSEAVNLKHDLDLQRLLKESHLLEQAKASSSLGTHRHKAVDMRMQSLGSKGSLFHQEKMPLAHRKGMSAKAAARDTGRRKEAKENGIILERATNKSKAGELRRERGVDVPTVGRFRGGTLRLSKKDVFDIQGPAQQKGPRGKGRRR